MQARARAPGDRRYGAGNALACGLSLPRIARIGSRPPAVVETAADKERASPPAIRTA